MAKLIPRGNRYTLVMERLAQCAADTDVPPDVLIQGRPIIEHRHELDLIVPPNPRTEKTG